MKILSITTALLVSITCYPQFSEEDIAELHAHHQYLKDSVEEEKKLIRSGHYDSVYIKTSIGVYEQLEPLVKLKKYWNGSEWIQPKVRWNDTLAIIAMNRARRMWEEKTLQHYSGEASFCPDAVAEGVDGFSPKQILDKFHTSLIHWAYLTDPQDVTSGYNEMECGVGFFKSKVSIILAPPNQEIDWSKLKYYGSQDIIKVHYPKKRQEEKERQG